MASLLYHVHIVDCQHTCFQVGHKTHSCIGTRPPEDQVIYQIDIKDVKKVPGRNFRALLGIVATLGINGQFWKPRGTLILGTFWYF